MDKDLNKFFEEVGISYDESTFESNSPIPPDRAKLEGYKSRSLAPIELEETRFLIATYWDWHVAYRELCLESKSDNDSIHESIPDETLAEIERYMSMDDKALDREFISCLGEEELAMSMRSGGHPLRPFLNRIQPAVCNCWIKLKEKKADPESIAVIIAIADSIASCSLQLPFPLTLVGTYLVRKGLDRICSPKQKDK